MPYKIIQKITLIVTGLLLFLGLGYTPVMAQTNPLPNDYRIKAEVVVRVEGTNQGLITIEETTPGAKQNTQNRVVNGKETLIFGFNDVGTWKYRVIQKNGGIEGVNYDNSIYTIEIYVTTDEARNLYVTALMFKEGSGEKESEIVFKNTIPSTPTPTPTANPNGNNGSNNGTNKNGTNQSESQGTIAGRQPGMGADYNLMYVGILFFVAIAGLIILVYTKFDDKKKPSNKKVSESNKELEPEKEPKAKTKE